MSNQEAIKILQAVRAFMQEHPRPVAEMPCAFCDEPVTVVIQEVDEDGRAYAINPAGNMEYPFVDTLMNLRPDVDVAGLVRRDITRKVMVTE